MGSSQHKTFYYPLYFFLGLYLIALVMSMAVMEIAAWTLFLFFLVYTFREGKSRIKVPIGFWPALMLTLIAILSGLYNELPSKNFWESVGKFRWIILYLSFFNLLLISSVREFVYNYRWILLPPIFLTAVYGISQFWTGYDLLRGEDFFFPPAVSRDGVTVRWRTIGFFNNPLTYGYSLGLFFIGLLCYLYYLLPKRKGTSWLLYAVTFLALTISMFTTYTRGVWLALVVAAVGSLWFLNKKVTFMFALATFVSFGSYFALDQDFRERLVSVTDLKNTSNMERMVLWRMNLEIFKDHPIIGVGFDENSNVIKDYLEKYAIKDVEPSHAHNTYLNFAASLGILGLLAYLAFIGSLLWHSLKYLGTHQKNEPLYFLAAAFFGMQLVIYVGGLTQCNFKDAEVNHAFIFICALYSAFMLSEQKNSPKLSHK